MLPDYVQAKGKLRKAYVAVFRMLEMQNAGPVGCLPARRFFEGHRIVLHREDGSISEAGQKRLTAEVKVDLRDVEGQRPGEMLSVLGEHAKGLAREKSKFFYEKLHQELSAAGQAVNLGGKPITPDVILDMFDRVQIDFNEDGSPRMPAFVAGSEFLKAIEPAMKELVSSPEYGRRFMEMMQRKKLEWLEREANRKLVG